MAVSLGPFAVPLTTLLFIAVFAAALVAAALAGRGRVRPACGALFDILLVGLVAARIGFVGLYFDQYAGHWLAMLDIRDGGFSAWVGIPAALTFALFLGARRRSLRRPLAVAAVVSLCAGVLVHNVADLEPAIQKVPAVMVTRLADGKRVNLPDEQAGKPRVVNLWASWCPPCRHEMPILEQARGAHPGIAFQLIDQGEGRDTVRAFLAKLSLPADPILLDPRGALGRAVGSRVLPITLFFNARGELTGTHIGALSRATLHRYLQGIAGDRPASYHSPPQRSSQ